MVELTRSRLSKYGPRVCVEQTDGIVRLPVDDASQDAVFSNYVLDLLSEHDIDRFVGEAARVLRPNGLLCLTGLGTGSRPGPRLVALGWSLVHRIRPSLVGGCRPLAMRAWLPEDRWSLRYSGLHDHWCVPSEVLVGVRQAAAQQAVAADTP
jgi:ubiquinone/menaquinone biosynthesis C-methylase UbiE